MLSVLLLLRVIVLMLCFFFFKQKTAYEMRISDWSSDVCSSDLETTGLADPAPVLHTLMSDPVVAERCRLESVVTLVDAVNGDSTLDHHQEAVKQAAVADRLVLTKLDVADPKAVQHLRHRLRSEEHTSELQSLMRISYAVFCLKKKHKEKRQ